MSEKTPEQLKHDEYKFRQDELYQFYLDAITPERTELEQKFKEIDALYQQKTKPAQDQYELDIEKEFKWASGQVLPKKEAAKRKIDDITRKAKAKADLVLKDLAEHQDKIQARFNELTRPQKEAFDKAVEADAKFFEAEKDRLQKDFEEKTKGQHEEYLAMAKKLEQDFGFTPVEEDFVLPESTTEVKADAKAGTE